MRAALDVRHQPSKQRVITPLVQDVVKDRVSSWLGVYYMVTAFGRFAGPLIIGAVTRMATPDGRGASMACDVARGCIAQGCKTNCCGTRIHLGQDLSCIVAKGGTLYGTVSAWPGG